jgi:hypothetical protein
MEVEELADLLDLQGIRAKKVKPDCYIRLPDLGHKVGQGNIDEEPLPFFVEERAHGSHLPSSRRGASRLIHYAHVVKGRGRFSTTSFYFGSVRAA